MFVYAHVIKCKTKIINYFEFTKKFPDENRSIDFIVSAKRKGGYVVSEVQMCDYLFVLGRRTFFSKELFIFAKTKRERVMREKAVGWVELSDYDFDTAYVMVVIKRS